MKRVLIRQSIDTWFRSKKEMRKKNRSYPCRKERIRSCWTCIETERRPVSLPASPFASGRTIFVTENWIQRKQVRVPLRIVFFPPLTWQLELTSINFLRFEISFKKILKNVIDLSFRKKKVVHRNMWKSIFFPPSFVMNIPTGWRFYKAAVVFELSGKAASPVPFLHW